MRIVSPTGKPLNFNDRKIESNNPIPEGYIQLKKIKITGNFRINYTNKNEIAYNDKIYGKCSFGIISSSLGDDQRVVETTGEGSWSRVLAVGFYQNGWLINGSNCSYGYNTSYQSYPSPEIFEWYNVGNIIGANGIETTTSPETTTAKRRIDGLCTEYITPVDFYYLAVSRNDVDFIRFVPVKRKSDNTLGIFEIYTQQFITGPVSL